MLIHLHKLFFFSVFLSSSLIPFMFCSDLELSRNNIYVTGFISCNVALFYPE